MQISLIAAATDSGIIGRNNQLPWHIPSELQYFKQVTLGKKIIMGRKTFDSLPAPLPKRENIVLSKQNQLDPRVTWVNSVDQIMNLFAHNQEEIMVIGGETLYRLFLPLATKIYLTRVHTEVEGDAFFPELDTTEWLESSRSEKIKDGKSSYNYTLFVYNRLITKNNIK